ncbi:MAG: family 10 glycosylhydrolase [Spirochaetes bacterium]|nr:family 10 glycosylhydrolase [Spirochaetota bacterium]
MKIKKTTAIIALFPLLILSCSREQVKPLNVKRNFSGSLWIVRNSIATPDRIDDLLDMIEDSDIKNLFVQVRGRGDAYYNSALEPAGFDVKKGFDPLKYLISRTRKTDIRIHAWVNVAFVMNAGDYPGDPEHILTRHPEWITCDYRGRPMTDYSEKELAENLVEGYFVDPALPEVKQHIYSVIKDILQAYDIDGIHLDYVRYPYSGYNSYYKRYLSDFGYSPGARKIFRKKYGIDPVRINRKKESKARAAFDRFRREQITEIVRHINAIVKQKDKSLIMSAASMPRHDYGKKVYFQDWPMWLSQGYIDLACVMSYTDNMDTYNSYLEYANITGQMEKIFMGVMVKENTGLKTVMAEISAAYDYGARGYVLFSFEHDDKYINGVSRVIDYSRYVFKLP